MLQRRARRRPVAAVGSGAPDARCSPLRTVIGSSSSARTSGSDREPALGLEPASRSVRDASASAASMRADARVRGSRATSGSGCGRSPLRGYPGYDDYARLDLPPDPRLRARARAGRSDPPDAGAAGQDADEEDAQHPGVRHGRLERDAEHAAVLPRAADRRPLRRPAQEADRRAASSSGSSTGWAPGAPRRRPRSPTASRASATCRWTRPGSSPGSSPTRGC